MVADEREECSLMFTTELGAMTFALNDTDLNVSQAQLNESFARHFLLLESPCSIVGRNYILSFDWSDLPCW